MYDNFKIANYNNSLVSPEFYAKPLSRLFSGDVIDGLTVVPGTGLQVTLQPGNAFLRYGSAAVASARIVSLVADFNLAIPTPDASNPRIDLVVVYVDTAVNLPVVDATHPPTSANLDGPGVPKAKIVSGTPAATPVAPIAGTIQSSVGASNPYTVVAQVLVDKAPVSVIAAGKITDKRKIVASSSNGAVDANGWADYGTYFVKSITYTDNSDIAAFSVRGGVSFAAAFGVPVMSVTPSVSNTVLDEVMVTDVNWSPFVRLTRSSTFGGAYTNTRNSAANPGGRRYTATVYGRAA